jgi:hypothetical protein
MALGGKVDIEEFLSQMHSVEQVGPVIVAGMNQMEKKGYWTFSTWCPLCTSPPHEMVQVGGIRIDLTNARATAQEHAETEHQGWTGIKASRKQ